MRRSARTLLLLITAAALSRPGPVRAQGAGVLPWISSPVARPVGVEGIYANPAGLAFSPGTELVWAWDTERGREGRDWGTFLKLGPLGISAERWGVGPDRGTDWTVAAGWRLSERWALGYSYRWVDAGPEVWSAGLVRRIAPWLLTGLYGTDLNQPGGREPRVTSGLTLEFLRGALRIGAEGTLFSDPASGREYGDELRPALHLGARVGSGIGLRAVLGEDLFYAGVEFALGGTSLGVLRRTWREGGDEQGHLTWLRLGGGRYESLWGPPAPRHVLIDLRSIPPEEPVTLFGILPIEEDTLLDLLITLRGIADDPDAGGVVLRLGGEGTGWAARQEIRDGLRSVREAGKEVIVWAESLGMGGLYLASAADSVFVPPSGSVELTGLAFELEFLAGTLEKLGVEAEFVKIDEYKSAPERFTRTAPSEENLEMTRWLLDSYVGQFKGALRGGRGVTPGRVDAWFDHGPFTGPEALDAGLVDGLAYSDQVLGEGEGARGREIVSRRRWEEGRHLRTARWFDPLRPRVAVVYATGAIVSGESGTDLLQGSLMGAETVVRTLRRAREDPFVKAIVLRVDSPGGSSLASDMIWREVDRTVSEAGGKPLVVSMGNAAASGGYYISCAADQVVARAGTVTGSIGIFGGKFDLSGLYEKIGYSVVRVEEGAFAGAYSMHRGLTDAERLRLEEVLQQGYDRFVGRVADGRGMSRQEVEGIARGRVWTGAQAVENGLVDRLGGLLDAAVIAAEQAGLEPGSADVVRYTADGSGMEELSAGRFLGLAAPRPSGPGLPEGADRALREALSHWETLRRLGEDERFYLMETVPVIRP
ncbi:MAG: signal peptide peptidase SppA [bacterium]